MKIAFVYPRFERHADAHPELREHVSCNEYVGPPSLGIASVAATTPSEHEVVFHDDRVEAFDPDALDADLYALSFFTPAATRAFEIGDALLARGKSVVMGGIFPSMMPDEAAPHCTSVVVGEGEVVWPRVVADAVRGKLSPRYVAEPADLAELPPPDVQLYFDAERANHHPDDYPLQISRGCPLACDACVIPRYLGKKVRFHTDQNLEATMERFAAAGKRVSLTEDISVTFAGGARRHFRRFLQRVLELQDRGLAIEFSYLGISMPMILHLDEGLLDLLRRTGIDRFYLVGGFDPITRQAFGTGDPKAMDKAERTIARAQAFSIDPYVSFMVGNEDDDDKVFDRILDFSRRTGVDLAEFVITTPYPGTPLWEKFVAEDRIVDREWKHYNDANVVFRHPRIPGEVLQDGYIRLWREFYGGREDDLKNRAEHRRTIQF